MCCTSQRDGISDTHICMYVSLYVYKLIHFRPIHLLCSTFKYIIYYIDSTVNDFNEEDLSTLLQFGDKGNNILLLLFDL